MRSLSSRWVPAVATACFVLVACAGSGGPSSGERTGSAKQADDACPAGQFQCSGVCIDPSSDPNNCAVCGQVCASGICTMGTCAPCPAPMGECRLPGVRPYCADIRFDSNNCGACGNVCPGTTTCYNRSGVGTCACPPGFNGAPGWLRCNDQCKEPDSNDACGSCDVQCAAGQTCVATIGDNPGEYTFACQAAPNP
jgi:hypothetical protein